MERLSKKLSSSDFRYLTSRPTLKMEDDIAWYNARLQKFLVKYRDKLLPVRSLKVQRI
jgi:hypothetical protein